MQIGRLDSLYAGSAEHLTTVDGTPFSSAIRKKQIPDAVLTTSGLPGDESFEDVHHTADKDIHVFAFEHYDPIGERLGMTLPRPTFGENFSTLGFTEADIFVGDRLRVGAAVLEVSQPTERCKTIGRSLGEPRVLKVLHQLNVCGFYARVLETGEVEAGDDIILIERQQEEWSILRLHTFMFSRLTDENLREEVLSLPQLTDDWKARIPKMLDLAERGEPLNGSLAAVQDL